MGVSICMTTLAGSQFTEDVMTVTTIHIDNIVAGQSLTMFSKTASQCSV